MKKKYFGLIEGLLFFAVVVFGIIAIGYLFNSFGYLLI